MRLKRGIRALFPIEFIQVIIVHSELAVKKNIGLFIGLGIVLLAIPLLINWLVSLHTPRWMAPIAGSSNPEIAWIGFWSNYIGSIFAALVAFYVLYKTLKQNEKENITNRKEAHSENLANSQRQLMQLKYEVAKQNLSELRNTLVDCFLSMEQDRTNNLLWELQAEDSTGKDVIELRQDLSVVVDDENRAFYKLELLFPRFIRNAEIDGLLTDIRRYSVESHMCLFDLGWLYQLYSDSSIDLSNRVDVETLFYQRSKNHSQQNRLIKDGYQTIVQIVINNKWFDLITYKTDILDAWRKGRDMVNSFMLSSLNALNENQTRYVESIIH